FSVNGIHDSSLSVSTPARAAGDTRTGTERTALCSKLNDNRMGVNVVTLRTLFPQCRGFTLAGLQAYLAFTATVKHGNFAGAAREMGLSASAVAKSVSRLETDLGVRLFHRTTRQVTLTSDGHELHERCKHITDEIEALRND